MPSMQTAHEPQDKNRAYGRVMGIVIDEASLQAVVEQIHFAKLPVRDLELLCGEHGIEVFEKTDRYFLAEGEHGAIHAFLAALHEGACVLVARADNAEAAERVAAIGKLHGGHHFTYFGPLVVKQFN